MRWLWPSVGLRWTVDSMKFETRHGRRFKYHYAPISDHLTVPIKAKWYHLWEWAAGHGWTYVGHFPNAKEMRKRMEAGR